MLLFTAVVLLVVCLRCGSTHCLASLRVHKLLVSVAQNLHIACPRCCRSTRYLSPQLKAYALLFSVDASLHVACLYCWSMCCLSPLQACVLLVSAVSLHVPCIRCCGSTSFLSLLLQVYMYLSPLLRVYTLLVSAATVACLCCFGSAVACPRCGSTHCLSQLPWIVIQ